MSRVRQTRWWQGCRFAKLVTLRSREAKPVIRSARLGDADAMGLVHVRAWQAVYRGVMPDDYLDGLQADDRAEMWRRGLTRSRSDQQLTVIEVDGAVVGFAASGRESDEQTDGETGELYAINLDPEHWGEGLGRALLRHVTRALANTGFRTAVLWVVPENERARGLYESEGWLDDNLSRKADVLGVTVTEMRYRRQQLHQPERPRSRQSP
jgi:ribosomal protein S18 acetylase RimI-like enzyme